MTKSTISVWGYFFEDGAPFGEERIVGRSDLSPRLLDSLELIPRTGTRLKKRGSNYRDLIPASR